MSNKSLSKNNVDYSNDAMPTAGDKQSLLLSAYFDEKATWDEQKNILRNDIGVAIEKLNSAKRKCESEFKITKLIYNQILKRNTPAENNLCIAQDNLNSLNVKMLKLINSEPNVDMYELAVFGSNLFKPR